VSPNSLGEFLVQTCNLTTLDKKIYDIVSEQYLPSSERNNTYFYGQGTLKYSGFSNSVETKVIGSMKMISSGNSSYLVRSESPSSFNQLNQIVKSNSALLLDLKISKTEALGFVEIPNGIDIDSLLSDSIKTDRSTVKKRYKPSVGDNTFTIGSKSSKLLIIQIAKIQGTGSKKYCLSLYSKVAETAKPSFMKKLAQYGLGLEDIHALTIRNLISSIVDCDLKMFINDFISKRFYLPSDATLATKVKKSEYKSAKVRYLASAFGASFKYLEDPQHSEEAINLLQDYLPKIQDSLTKCEAKKSKKKSEP
jgi:hypothetical protein